MRRMRPATPVLLVLLAPLCGCIILPAAPVPVPVPYAADDHGGLPPAPYYGAPVICPTPAGSALAGAWQGGVSGAVIGSFWGDAGRGAAIGAGLGALAGAAAAGASCP